MASKPAIPTTADIRTKLSGGTLYGPLEAAAVDACAEARAFHWPLAFPDVMIARGGFDVVLGNPPWEVVQLGEEEYFATRAPEIAALKGATRKRAIAALAADHPEMFADYERDKRRFEAVNEFARASGRFDLTARGKVNTYGLFAEHFLNLTREGGRAGVIVPTGIATDATTAPFFGYLVSGRRLAGLIDFENSAPIFPGVHRSYKFCLLTIGSGVKAGDFAFFLTDPAQRDDARRRFTLTPDDIARINPNTKTAPVFRAEADAELTAKIYARVPVLIEEGKGVAGNKWGVEFRQGLFNMTSDSHLFRTAAQLEAEGFVRVGSDWLKSSPAFAGEGDHAEHGGGAAARAAGQTLRFAPGPSTALRAVPLPGGAGEELERYVLLYEAKMIHFYDHRFGDYGSRGDDRGYRVMPETPLASYQDPSFEPSPYYWVSAGETAERLGNWQARQWLLAFKDVTASTNERTVIFSAIPRAGVGHTAPLMFSRQSAQKQSALLANLNSLILDAVARTKVAGLHLTYGYLKQFPILPPARLQRSRPRLRGSARAGAELYQPCDGPVRARPGL